MQNEIFRAPTGYPAPYPNFYPAIPDPKAVEKRALRKASNGLGFFVFTYFILMMVCSLIIGSVVGLASIATEQNLTSLESIIQILCILIPPLIAGFFYRILSRRRISDTIPKSFVPLKKLVPMLLLGMAAAMIANQLAQMFDNNISLFSLHNNAPDIENSQTGIEMLLSFICTAICPALAEEFAFRGIFMGVMRKYGDAFAVFSSALVFGAMHGNTTQIVFAFVLGLIFGYLDCKANSIIPSVLLHFGNNFYAVLTDFLRTAIPDEQQAMLIIMVIISLFYILGILSFIYLARTDKSFFRMSNADKNPYSGTDILSFKEKITTLLTSPGIIVSLSVFLVEMLIYLIPTDSLGLTGAIGIG